MTVIGFHRYTMRVAIIFNDGYDNDRVIMTIIVDVHDHEDDIYGNDHIRSSTK